MERSTIKQLHAQQDGKVTLLTLIAMLALVVLCGFIGNAGHAVTEKMEVQNAADTAALETAQWMARGMNAVTATNHLIGEATAIVTLIDALGGPEALYGEPYYPPQSRALDTAIDNLKTMAPIKGPPYYVPPGIDQIDKSIMETILKLTTPQSTENRKHKAFATIYDSKITLKRELIKLLLLKSLANVGFAVPPPWGYLTAIAAYAAHIHGTKEVVLVGKEWIILEAFERFLTFGATKRVLREFNEAVTNKLIPMLVKHGDFVTGNLNQRTSSTTPAPANNGQARRGIVNHAIEATMLELAERHQVKSFIYPAAKDLRLPVEREPRPSLRAGGKLSAWGKDDSLGGNIGLGLFEMQQMQGKINDSKDEINYRIYQVRQDIAELDRVEDGIDSLLRRENLTDQQRQQLRQEKDAVRESRKRFQEKLDELNNEMKKLREKEREFLRVQQQVANLPKTSGNLTTDHINQKLVPQLLNQDEERQTQWARATYPYVDAFRAGLLSNMKEHLSRAEAAKHWEKWTNRFTLIKSWELRSGYRYQSSTGAQAYWTKRQERLHMYVMKGTYDGGPNAKPNKGHESWTQDTDAAKREAEETYTVLGVAHRQFKPHFSPIIYPIANKQGITAFAQAIYYNANPQEPAPAGSKPGASQVSVGWDTLNWSPETPTPEWGSRPSEAEDQWPWEMFSAARSLGSATVKLNWQAKLMPVRKSRFEQAAMNRDLVQIVTAKEARLNLLFVLPFFDKLVTH